LLLNAAALSAVTNIVTTADGALTLLYTITICAPKNWHIFQQDLLIRNHANIPGIRSNPWENSLT
jgi:hypothetical protein